MVKVPLRCPFSKGPCRGCATYRGRHYYICYHRDLRGPAGRRATGAEGSSQAAPPPPKDR